MSDLHQPAPPLRLELEQSSGASRLFQDINVLDYFKALYKRRWTVVIVATVVFLSFVIYSFTATPIYRATARILIENENPNIVSFEQVLQLDRLRASQDYYQTQYKMLESRSLAEQ